MSSAKDVERDEIFTRVELEDFDNMMAMYDELDRQNRPGFLLSDIFGFSLKKRVRRV
ncbi:hypothetical protein [Corynebacterium lowii]|uniref:hypothetical protein n=1 Tax=Corynebacterium lowii TaxID=1544413 RepID=UPI000A9F8E10|nr:hypothetical protein [Corynebacterium lowii]MDP9852482.1 hypothetical protein [Corynebacterium lowii]